MFCTNCGKPTEGDQILCNECAAQKANPACEAPIQPAQPVAPAPVFEQPAAPVAPQQPVFETFDLNVSAEPEKPKKKKKKGLVAAIISGVAAIAIAAAVFFNWDYVSNLFNRVVKSPEDYMQQVSSDGVAEFSSSISKAYGVALKALNSTETAGSIDIGLTIGKEILNLAETALAGYGADVDLDFLNKLNLSIEANMQDSAMQYTAGVSIGGKQLASMDVILDMANGMLYMAIPELNSDYTFVELPDMAQVSEMTTAMMDAMGEMTKALPSEAEFAEMSNTYAELALAEITDVEEESETISIDGKSQKMTVLTAEISEETLYAIAKAVLKQVEDDKTIEKIFDAINTYGNKVNELNGYAGAEFDLYEEFIEGIPDVLDELEYMQDEADDSNYIEVVLYVDAKGAIRGLELEVVSDGETMNDNISWLTVEKGGVIDTEAELSEVLITGEKTVKKGVSSGFYEVEAGGMVLGKVEFENMTETSGTLRLIPSEEIVSNIMSTTGIPSSMVSDNVALELVMANNSMDINFLVGSKTLLGLSLSSTTSNGGKISMPNSVVDQQTWASGLDPQKLLDRLEDCGISEELINELVYLFN